MTHNDLSRNEKWHLDPITQSLHTDSKKIFERAWGRIWKARGPKLSAIAICKAIRFISLCRSNNESREIIEQRLSAAFDAAAKLLHSTHVLDGDPTWGEAIAVLATEELYDKMSVGQ